jgi:hypothetical protein
MRNSLDKPRVTIPELIFFLIGALLILLLGSLVANGQSVAPKAIPARGGAQAQQPLYREYRGVRLGMTATEVRTKLGEPALKSDEQDFFVISANETAQIAYNAAQRVMTISTDYAGGIGAPDYRTAVGEGMLLTRPDGSVFKMAMYDSERFWVTYNKSAATVPTVTITIGAYK